MYKLKICKENMPKINQIVKSTLLNKGKFVKIHEIKQSKSFWKQRNNIKKIMSDYDRCYDIKIHNDYILIETETYSEPSNYDEFPEMLWDTHEIKEGYFYYSGNGKEFWIEKYNQPQEKFAKMFISTIEHFVIISNKKEYKNIESQLVYATHEQIKELGDMLLKILG